MQSKQQRSMPELRCRTFKSSCRDDSLEHPQRQGYLLCVAPCMKGTSAGALTINCRAMDCRECCSSMSCSDRYATADPPMVRVVAWVAWRAACAKQCTPRSFAANLHRRRTLVASFSQVPDCTYRAS